MTYDPPAAYRSAQVTTSSPAAQVVLLYEGAIRFTAMSIQRMQAKDLEGSHVASVRAQAIVSALRESLAHRAPVSSPVAATVPSRSVGSVRPAVVASGAR